ncbi:MAG: DUF1906 domain-containing protein [Actinobacteria bacterium]|nr:DUF1906 domain-containing protein [Actinomycetota bacterium]
MPGRRPVILLAAAGGCAALAAVIFPAGSAKLTGTTPGLKAVAYAGYRFEVPVSWPVFGLSGRARTCVRFDLHAVYLGTPAVDELCPSKLIGTTEAIEIQPGPGTGHRETLEDAVSRTITARAPGIVATATFDTDRSVITGILASAGLARPVVQTAELGTGDFAAAATPPALSAQVANQVGLGFDTCAAPSSRVMQAWLARSPYRAIGIYIGGADRACAQPNLTQAWVTRQARSGWHFIPMYAGPQPALGEVTAPARQGTATAMDAAAQARRLGFGPGTPLYYNTEAYPPQESVATLRFLSAWTTELHRLGYASGVYSSSGSGIADLARQYRTGRYAIPDVIYDALRNGQANTVDRVIRPGEWPGSRRIHQFSGNVLQRFGGQSMLIDQDFLDVALPVRSTSSALKSLAPAAGTTQSSAALMNADGTATVFFAGPGHQLIQQSQSAAGHWTRTNLGGFLTSDPSAVQTSPDSIEVFYRGAGDRLWERTCIGTHWLTARQLPQLGSVGAPHGVSGLGGVVDVFWRGLGGVHLWHAQFDPKTGWAGPQNLGGTLATDDPYPVESPSGHVEVFWRGDNGRLWRVLRNAGAVWSRPQDLGTATLAVRPQAAALSNSEIDVLWRGTSAPRWISSLVLRPTSGAVTSVSTGALGTARPWVVVAAGKEWIVYRAMHGGLRVVTRETGGRWSASSWIRGGTLVSAPFAAAGPGSGPLVVFWTGPDNQLFAQRFTQAGGWGRAADLGAIG